MSVINTESLAGVLATKKQKERKQHSKYLKEFHINDLKREYQKKNERKKIPIHSLLLFK